MMMYLLSVVTTLLGRERKEEVGLTNRTEREMGVEVEWARGQVTEWRGETCMHNSERTTVTQ